MINKMQFNNFKCFTNLELDFKQMTILTGINGAGKSSIVQGILLYDQATKMDNHSIINTRETLGVEIGTPKNLVSQSPDDYSGGDFRIGINEKNIDFLIDKENSLDLTCVKNNIKRSMRITYLNAERMGPRMSYVAGGGDDFHYDGGNAIYLMEKADLNGNRIPDILIADDTMKKFSYQVECWLSIILGKTKIETSVNYDKALAEIRIRNNYTDLPVIPTLTGFGISYELSVIIAGLWVSTQENSVFIVENPEAHLHPAAQSMIGKFLAIVAASGVQVIVETHSEHIVDGARIQMCALENTHEMVTNFFTHSNGNIIVKPLVIDDKGELSEWPDQFFDQKQKDLRELFNLRRKNGSN